jgi:hypothetical protein
VVILDELFTLSKVNRDVAPSIGDLLVVGVNDSGCPKCGSPQFIGLPATARAGNEAVLICNNCLHVLNLHDSSTQVQFAVEDRINLIIKLDGPIAASQRMASLFATSNSERPQRSTHQVDAPASLVPSSETKGDEAPEGFRTVSWIREYEAKLILSSYTNQRGYTLKSDDDSPIFETEFYPTDSPEAKKFRAQVLAVRIRKSGRRNVGWIRREEAQAVLDSYGAKDDVEFRHTQFGRGGLVQYFPAESPLVSKYRSQTRLLRRR